MSMITQRLDVVGQTCPKPLLRAIAAIEELDEGDVLMIVTTEPESIQNMNDFCRQTGNKMLEHVEEDGEFTFMIEKHSH